MTALATPIRVAVTATTAGTGHSMEIPQANVNTEPPAQINWVREKRRTITFIARATEITPTA
ncbi:hypothetical protein D3C85_1844700 [compost metagenome]